MRNIFYQQIRELQTFCCSKYRRIDHNKGCISKLKKNELARRQIDEISSVVAGRRARGIGTSRLHRSRLETKLNRAFWRLDTLSTQCRNDVGLDD